MLTVVIPTLNVESTLRPLLEQLSGKVDRLVIADGDSVDGTLSIACQYEARIAMGGAGRGHQLARGARWADGAEWMLFLHADTKLPANWRTYIDLHVTRHSNSAGYFRFGANARGVRARMLEVLVGLRCSWLKWPYGDQGLLISRAMYDAAGGYPGQALFEDVALVKAIKAKCGRRALRPLKGKIMTDISAYYRDGFFKRGTRNLGLLRGYLKGDDLAVLTRQYT